MNNVTQFWDSDTISTTGSSQPLSTFIISDRLCFRVRAVEFRWHNSVAGTNRRFFVGLSKKFNDLHFGSSVPNLNNYAAMMAFDSREGAVRGSAILLNRRVELWDYNYRLVMPPTIMGIGPNANQVISVGMYGELMPCSQAERNAIILWQGGP